MKREIVLDTETTGLDPAAGHRIIEIGCIEVVGAVRTGAFFHTYLNPERDIPEESRRVHGITEEFLRDKPVFAEKVDEWLEFIGDSPLVIHNAGFDLRFLNAELARLGFKPLSMDRAVDTVFLAKKKFPGSPASLDALCRRFDIDLSARTKHGALLDAELLADVYLELLGGRQVTFALDSRAAESGVLAPVTASPHQTLEQRHFPPAPEELAAHEAMLACLKQPLWHKRQQDQ